jgi:hypothetical protein
MTKPHLLSVGVNFDVWERLGSALPSVQLSGVLGSMKHIDLTTTETKTNAYLSRSGSYWPSLGSIEDDK